MKAITKLRNKKIFLRMNMIIL